MIAEPIAGPLVDALCGSVTETGGCTIAYWYWQDSSAHIWQDGKPAKWSGSPLIDGGGSGDEALSILWEDGTNILWEDSGEEILWEA